LKQILVIDDNPDVCSLLEQALSKLNYNVKTATTPRKGISMAQAKYADLILLDAVMPNMDGLEILKEIKDGGASQSTPVIMVTSKSNPQTVIKATSLGAVDFVVKPFDAGTLTHKVCRWINAKEEERWKHLEPEQEHVLKITLNTLDKAHKAVSDGKPLERKDVEETSNQIYEVIDKGKIKDVLGALKGHDSYTFVHSMRAGIFLTIFAKEIDGFSPDDVKIITEGGVVHDVGKAKTPLAVLNKPGGFDPSEWEVMKSHVDFGVEALQRTPGVPEPVIEIAWCHHEKLDGSGYPRGLKADQIGMLARMAAIVDMYTALSDRRVYKEGFSNDKCFSIMRENKAHLDQPLIDEFEELIKCGRFM